MLLTNVIPLPPINVPATGALPVPINTCPNPNALVAFIGLVPFPYNTPPTGIFHVPVPPLITGTAPDKFNGLRFVIPLPSPTNPAALRVVVNVVVASNVRQLLPLYPWKLVPSNRIDPATFCVVVPTRIPPATSNSCCGVVVPIPTFPSPLGTMLKLPPTSVVMSTLLFVKLNGPLTVSPPAFTNKLSAVPCW